MSYGNGGEYDRGNRPSNPNAVGSMQPQPAKSNALWWILGILAVVFVGGALVCCGGGYFAYRFGTEVAGTVVRDAVAGDPAIQEHIGTIEEINLNLSATGNAGGGSRMVFDVRGDKGTGQLEVTMDPGGQSVGSAVLVLPNGDRHDVQVGTPEQAPSNPVDSLDPVDSPPFETLETDAEAVSDADAVQN